MSKAIDKMDLVEGEIIDSSSEDNFGENEKVNSIQIRDEFDTVEKKKMKDGDNENELEKSPKKKRVKYIDHDCVGNDNDWYPLNPLPYPKKNCNKIDNDGNASLHQSNFDGDYYSCDLKSSPSQHEDESNEEANLQIHKLEWKNIASKRQYSTRVLKMTINDWLLCDAEYTNKQIMMKQRKIKREVAKRKQQALLLKVLLERKCSKYVECNRVEDEKENYENVIDASPQKQQQKRPNFLGSSPCHVEEATETWSPFMSRMQHHPRRFDGYSNPRNPLTLSPCLFPRTNFCTDTLSRSPAKISSLMSIAPLNPDLSSLPSLSTSVHYPGIDESECSSEEEMENNFECHQRNGIKNDKVANTQNKVSDTSAEQTMNSVEPVQNASEAEDQQRTADVEPLLEKEKDIKVENSHGADGTSPSPEQQMEEKSKNWYNSDEDDTEYQPLNTVLKKLQQTPLSNVPQQNTSPEIRSTIDIDHIPIEIQQQKSSERWTESEDVLLNTSPLSRDPSLVVKDLYITSENDFDSNPFAKDTSSSSGYSSYNYSPQDFHPLVTLSDVQPNIPPYPKGVSPLDRYWC